MTVTWSEPCTLTPADHALVMAKNSATRVGFALLLLFYRVHGRFPTKRRKLIPKPWSESLDSLDWSPPLMTGTSLGLVASVGRKEGLRNLATPNQFGSNRIHVNPYGRFELDMNARLPLD
jgi:hypothetical protein